MGLTMGVRGLSFRKRLPHLHIAWRERRVAAKTYGLPEMDPNEGGREAGDLTIDCCRVLGGTAVALNEK